MMKRQTRKCVLVSRAGSDSASPLESILSAGLSGPSGQAVRREDGPCMAHGPAGLSHDARLRQAVGSARGQVASDAGSRPESSTGTQCELKHQGLQVDAAAALMKIKT